MSAPSARSARSASSCVDPVDPVDPGDLPVLAEVVRSGFVEGHHRGSLVILAADGSVDFALGAPERPVFPRSSNKPMQAAAVLRTGLDLDGRYLALPDGRALAFKIDDGAKRALAPVLAATLRRLGVTTEDGTLARIAASPLLGGGAPVGEVRAAF